VNRELARRAGGVFLAGLVVGLVVLGVAAAEPAASAKHGGLAKVQGGTAYFAEGSQATPNYIFPFAGLQFFSTVNSQQFQMLMYRPLYWFGTASQPTLNLSLSLVHASRSSVGKSLKGPGRRCRIMVAWPGRACG